MRRVFVLLLLFAAASRALFAQSPSIRFDPPAPTSQTAVTITVSGVWGDGCPPRQASAMLSGRRILVTLFPSQTPCPIIPVMPVPFRVSAFVGTLAAGTYEVEVLVPTTTLPLTFAETTLLVRDAEPELEVRPSVVQALPATVRIRGNGIGTCPPNVSPCIPPVLEVAFNGTKSTQVRIINADEIEALVPGILGTRVITVAVTADDGRPWETEGALILASPNGLYDPQAFERILIPVILEGPGAFGAQWITDAWIENAEDYDVRFFRAPFATLPCGIPEGCDVPPIPKRSTRRIESQWPTGVFIYPERGADVRLNVLVRDLSRQAEALGTEVPVVREDDWKSGKFGLLNVPADPRFRVSLRVYFEENPQFGFFFLPVRITRMTDDISIVETTIGLDFAHNGIIPAAGFIADIGTQLGIPAGTPLRIEVGPAPGGVKIWGFASVTNNTTQHVTVISPQ
jgi:hypothetical protein